MYVCVRACVRACVCACACVFPYAFQKVNARTKLLGDLFEGMFFRCACTCFGASFIQQTCRIAVVAIDVDIVHTFAQDFS